MYSGDEDEGWLFDASEDTDAMDGWVDWPSPPVSKSVTPAQQWLGDEDGCLDGGGNRCVRHTLVSGISIRVVARSPPFQFVPCRMFLHCVCSSSPDLFCVGLQQDRKKKEERLVKKERGVAIGTAEHHSRFRYC